MTTTETPATKFTLGFHRNDGTPHGETWTTVSADVPAALEHYRDDEVPVTVTITGADGGYVGMARAGGGKVQR